jgi:Zn-dependent protease with chaperone function
MLSVLLAFLACGAAVAAIQRPNALDHRVDAIAQSTLLAEPATMLADAARQQAALRRAHWTLPGFVLVQILEAIALFYLWSSGGAAALRDRLRRRFTNETVVRFLFGAGLALIARLAAFLPSFYLYRVDRTLGLSIELTRSWALAWLGNTLLGMLVAGLIAAIVLWLAERTHEWYVYTVAAILAMSVGWSYAGQYLQTATPAVRPVVGALSVQLGVVLARAHLSDVPVMVEVVHNSPSGGAVVLGLGHAHRILLTDTLVAGATPPEIAYEVAFELGHIVHHDLISIALIEGGIVIIFSALAVVIADRIKFRRDDDPLSRLAIVGALLALVYLAAVPVRNAALRSYDFGADSYAVALTGNPAAAVRALVRSSDQLMEEVCPELGATLFLYTHPGTGARIAAINHVPSSCP